MAKQRMRIYEGVRIDGVFTKVKMIKKFKTQATMELQALTTIDKTANVVPILSLNSIFDAVQLLMFKKIQNSEDNYCTSVSINLEAHYLVESAREIVAIKTKFNKTRTEKQHPVIIAATRNHAAKIPKALEIAIMMTTSTLFGEEIGKELELADPVKFPQDLKSCSLNVVG
ncbi:hypothetical protein AC249_AIPGENE5007 [Exaiptasia diaphana]|nr:hypothetical protein AC249_AIPGENE5007 [Exaiptasia diaphana]